MIYRIINDGHKHAHRIASREALLRLRNSKANLLNLEKARKGDGKAKSNLIQLAYNLGHVENELAGCKSIGSFFFHDIDCYDAKQAAAYKDLILAKKDEIGLVMLERSASGGWHLVCRRERGKTILENQVRIATILQIEMDTNAHDLQRVVFSTSGSEEDLPYLDDELFTEPMTPAECEAEYTLVRERERSGQEDLPKEAKRSKKHFKPWLAEKEEGSGKTEEQNLGTSESDEAQTSREYPDNYHGIPFTDILKKYWEVNNNGFEPTEGDRDTLTFQLASDLRHICGKNFQWLDQVIPCYDRFPLEQKREKIRSALSSKYEGFPQRLRETLNALQVNPQPSDLNPQTSEATPPTMPKKLPKLVELLVSRTPEIYKPAVAHAIFPALATHLWKTKFRYIDNKLHEATLMNCLMAGTGAGKDCISEPIDHIMEDIRQSDAENLKREKEWKNEVNAKGANKDKKQRPEGLVIQEIDADMTNPAFVMRMAEADEHFLYVKLNEIDQFDALKGNGAGGQQFRIMCLAFDPNNRYGQTRIGTQSVTERVCIRFNWNCAGTINKVQRYFSRVLTDGPLSRINFCTIPEREIGAEIPVYGEYGEDFDEALKPYIEHLCAARGEITCPQAFALAKKLNEECAEFSRLSQSRVYENFSFRANVIAYLKACVLFVANDYQWEDTFDDFIRWSLQYDLWCKMQFFGEAIEKFNYDNERVGKRGPQNLLELLPETFNIDDAKKVRRQVGMDIENVGKMVSQWKTRGYILQLTVDSFQKVKKRPC